MAAPHPLDPVRQHSYRQGMGSAKWLPDLFELAMGNPQLDEAAIVWALK